MWWWFNLCWCWCLTIDTHDGLWNDGCMNVYSVHHSLCFVTNGMFHWVSIVLPIISIAWTDAADYGYRFFILVQMYGFFPLWIKCCEDCASVRQVELQVHLFCQVVERRRKYSYDEYNAFRLHPKLNSMKANCLIKYTSPNWKAKPMTVTAWPILDQQKWQITRCDRF